MTIDANDGYFETILRYFTETTGRAMFFSGRDWELLEAWRQQGASAAAICKGIREAAEAMPDGDPPSNIHACRRYIEPKVERASRRTVGGHDGRPAPKTEGRDDADASPDGETSSRSDATLADRALERIERAGRQHEREELKALYRQAWRAVRTLAEEEDASTASTYERLVEIEKKLVQRYFKALERSERRRIDRRIREESGEMLDRMSGGARDEHLSARRRRLLAEEHGFVPILE